MNNVKPPIKIEYEFVYENPTSNLNEVFNLLFEKALAMAKAKRLANAGRVSYINSNPQKEATL